MLEGDEWQALQSAIRNLCGLPGIHKSREQLRPFMCRRLQTVVDD